MQKMWTQESESVYWLKIENERVFAIEIHSERSESGIPLVEVTEIDSFVKIRYLGGVVSISDCRKMASVLRYAAAIAANFKTYKEMLSQCEKPAGKQGDLGSSTGKTRSRLAKEAK